MFLLCLGLYVCVNNITQKVNLWMKMFTSYEMLGRGGIKTRNNQLDWVWDGHMVCTLIKIQEYYFFFACLLVLLYCCLLDISTIMLTILVKSLILLLC